MTDFDAFLDSKVASFENDQYFFYKFLMAMNLTAEFVRVRE